MANQQEIRLEIINKSFFLSFNVASILPPKTH